jgi:uncharacterized protein
MDLHRYIAIAQGTLAILMVAIFPLIDLPAMRRLKRFSSGPARLAVYRRGIGWIWAFTIVAMALTSPSTLIVVPRHPGEFSWLDDHALLRASVTTIIALLFLWMLWPSVQCVFNKRIRQKYFRAYRSSLICFLLPVSRQERLWWVLLSVTAGICEELLYRGFMLQYLRGHLAAGPILHLTLAWLVSSFAFGAAHVYQGIRGMMETTAAGLIFGLLAILSGNLMLPIMLHSMIDLRILLTYHPEQDAPDEAATLIRGFSPQSR